MNSIHLHKIITVGSAFVGKTSLARRFTMNTFTYSYLPTMGVSWLTKTIGLTKERLNENLTKQVISDDLTIRLSLWDTGAQEIFGYLRPKYFLGAKVAIIVYDITNVGTFDDIDFWAEEIIRTCYDIPIILCGNKYDLNKARAVPKEDAIKYAYFRNFDYIETSALSGLNVEKLFIHASRLSVQQEENLLKFRKQVIFDS